MRKLSFVLSFLFSFGVFASNLTVILDKDLEGLKRTVCFHEWIQELEFEGYYVSVETLSKENHNYSNYKRIIRETRAKTVFLLGDLRIPKLSLLQKNKHNRNENVHVLAETLFPLYSEASFDKNGVDPNNVFFQDADISVGVLNLIYHRAENYSKKGLLSQYCKYFKKNIAYRTCDRGDSVKAAAAIDSDFYQLKGDVKLISNKAKTYTQIKDLLTGNNLDFAHIAAHANSKSIVYGKKNTPQRQSISTNAILKTDITTKFFNLYSCKVFEDKYKYNIGKAFIGGHSETLGVIGSTKSGAMAYPRIFFNYIKRGMPFGKALLKYLKYYATSYGGQDSYLDNNGYHSGLIFYGDPTLDLHSCKQ